MRNSPRATSITDFFIEVLIPVFIIGLIWSLVVFIIHLKGVFYPGQERVLIRVFFFYVMGSVMTHRIAGLYGESEKASVYSVLLVAVMALFALTFSARYGFVFGGNNAGEGLLANLAIVALVGIVSYKICRETCLDYPERGMEKSPIQIRAELRAERDWYRRMRDEEEPEKGRAEEGPGPDKERPDQAQARPSDRHPGIWIIYFSLFSMVVFAVGQRLLPEDNWRLYSRTFTCLVANLVSALGLMLLVTLSSLRLKCLQKKASVPGGVGVFWTLAGGSLILVAVSFASLPPRPVPEYLVRSATPVEPSTTAEGPLSETKSLSNQTWEGTSKQIEAKLEKEDRDREELAKQMKEGSGEGEKGGAPDADKDREKGEAGGGKKGADGSDQAKSDSTEQGSAQEGKSSSQSSRNKSSRNAGQSTRAKLPPAPSAPLQGLEALGRIVFFLVLACACLWAAMKLFSALGRANPIKGLTNRLKRLAGRLRGLLRSRKRVRAHRRKSKGSFEEDLYLESPFKSRSLLKSMSLTELVKYTYRAFENYAHLQGHTPLKGQTAIEFMRTLPEEFQSPEFYSLLRLYMLSEYSPHPVSSGSIKKLEEVWAKLES